MRLRSLRHFWRIDRLACSCLNSWTCLKIEKTWFLFTGLQKAAKWMTTCCNNSLTEGIVKRSHWMCSVKKTFLKISQIFAGKHLRCSLSLIKLQAFRLNSRSFKNIMFLCRFSPLCCGYVAVFPTLGFILLFFIENFSTQIDIGVRLKLVQKRIQNPLRHLRWSFFAKAVNSWEPLISLTQNSVVDVWLA